MAPAPAAARTPQSRERGKSRSQVRDRGNKAYIAHQERTANLPAITHDPAEEPAEKLECYLQYLIDTADYSVSTCLSVLRSYKGYLYRRDRLRPLISRGTCGDESVYTSFGLFRRGGITGITEVTSLYPVLSQYLNGYLKHHAVICGHTSPTWTSTTVGCDATPGLRTDHGNQPGSSNFTIYIVRSIHRRKIMDPGPQW